MNLSELNANFDLDRNAFLLETLIEIFYNEFDNKTKISMYDMNGMYDEIIHEFITSL